MKPVKIEFQRDPAWEFIDPIIPASQAIPNWYKEAQAYKTEAAIHDKTGMTFKACPAILDSMLQGYILPLWADVWVSPSEDGIAPVFTWAEGVDRGESDLPLVTWQGSPEVSKGFHHFDAMSSAPSTLKLNSPWLVKTPEGYSILTMPPLNNRDSRFEAVSGVVCSDVFTTYINIPLIWKAPPDYEGLIKQGTPLIQIMPFKREIFQQELSLTTNDGGDLSTREKACARKIGSVFRGGYRKFFQKTVVSK